ncbi:hypothetical protein M9458_024462, partial [Cirrhinus mrigala]
NSVLMADMPVLVFSGKCQLSFMVLGCEHKSDYRTSGPRATFMKYVFDSLVRNMHTNSILEVTFAQK